MIKWITLTAAIGWALVISAIWDGFVRVEPDEIALVTKGGHVVGQLEPGLRWKTPFIKGVAYVSAPFHFRIQGVELVGFLSDGSKCPVKAMVQYRIGNPRRAVEWRLANGLEVLQQNLKSGRNDYVEPRRLFKRLLLPVMKQITPQKAARGAVEAWIRKNDVKKMRSVKNSDGTRISGIRIMAVGCSMNKYLGKPYKPPVIKFGKPQKFDKNQRKKVSGEVHKGRQFSIEIMLNGNRSMMIDNLAIEYVIINEGRFKKHFGMTDKRYRYADIRITPDVKAMIRGAFKWPRVATIPSMDLMQIFRPDSGPAKKLEKWGVRLVNIANDKTSYRLQVKK